MAKPMDTNEYEDNAGQDEVTRGQKTLRNTEQTTRQNDMGTCKWQRHDIARSFR